MSTSIKSPKLPIKYKEVERTLRQEIAAGLWRPGDRLPAEYDLARRFNVSYLTMRQALATLVDEGALLRVRGKGTFIVDRAQEAPQSGARHGLALMLPTNWQRRDPYYFPDILDGFQQAMTAAGCRASLINDDVPDIGKMLPRGSAIACVLIEPEHVRIVERLRDNGYRVLGVNRYHGQRAVPSVRMDDFSGVESAVDHLVSLGHSQIAFLRGPSENFDANDRLAGFRAATKRHKLWSAMEAGDDFSEATGYAVAQMLLSLPKKPTALVCASDLSAIGAVRGATDLGLSVPGDLSIVGFGDFSVAQYVRPSLTTVRQCRVTLGRTAGEVLIRLANEEDVDDDILAAELIVRESTAPATAR